MTTNLLSASISSNVFSHSSRSQQFKMSLNDWKQHVTERWCISPLPFPASGSTNCLWPHHWSLCLHNHMTFSSSVSHNVKVSADCQLDRIQNHLGIPMTITWCTCENHLVCLWEPPGVPVRLTCCACENRLVYLWEFPGRACKNSPDVPVGNYFCCAHWCGNTHF